MVWDAFENERAGITLKFTVGMLKELKVRIVAEGVETQEQQMHLTGITLAQRKNCEMCEARAKGIEKAM